MNRNRRIHIADSLARALVRARLRAGIDAKPAISERVLEDVEQLLETELPDDIVAVFAATGRDLYQIVRLTDSAREDESRAPGELVLERSGKPARWWRARLPRVEGRVCRSGETRVASTSTLVSRLEEPGALERFVLAGVHSPETPREAHRIDVELLGFGVSVIADTTPKRRVSHPEFGEGLVLRELDGAKKLEVRFGRVSVRVMASFCRDVFEQGARP